MIQINVYDVLRNVFNVQGFIFYMHNIFLHAHARYLEGCSLLTYFPHTYVTSIDEHSFAQS